MSQLEPFSSEEMAARLDSIRTQMAESQLDALITSNAANVRYATGFRGEPRTLFLTANSATLFTSYRTLPWAHEQTQAVQSQVELNESSSPLEEIKKRLAGNPLKIGVDRTLTHSSFQTLAKEFTPHQLTPSTAIEHVRRTKSPVEIELLIKSQRLNEEIFEAVLPQITPAITERAVQGLILSEIAQREQVDSYSFPPIVATAGNAWEIHHLPDLTVLQKGDLVLLDLGVIYQGYASDMTRTITLGPASSQQKEIHALVGQAQEAAIAGMRPGTTTHEIDALARDIITKAGYERGFTHGLGHSIGLETHDPGPNLSPKSPAEKLVPGMAFTVEPGTYLEDAFGVRTEDVIIITEDGHTNITQQPKNLLEIPC